MTVWLQNMYTKVTIRPYLFSLVWVNVLDPVQLVLEGIIQFSSKSSSSSYVAIDYSSDASSKWPVFLTKGTLAT